jgi:hypothetical protein
MSEVRCHDGQGAGYSAMTAVCPLPACGASACGSSSGTASSAARGHCASGCQSRPAGPRSRNGSAMARSRTSDRGRRCSARRPSRFKLGAVFDRSQVAPLPPPADPIPLDPPIRTLEGDGLARIFPRLYAGKSRVTRRRGWDSNPRYACAHNGFRDLPVLTWNWLRYARLAPIRRRLGQ